MMTAVHSVPATESTAGPLPGSGGAGHRAPSGGPGHRRRPGRPFWLLFVPAAAVVAIYFVVPLAQVVWRSFSDPELGLSNYAALLTDGVTVTVILRTLGVALLVTGVTLLLAYPYAYAMTKVGPTGRAIMLALALLPFWTSLLARNFAWLLLLQDGGPVQSFFAFFGNDQVVLYGTLGGVTVAMSQVLLPYMILPLYSSMQSIDRRLLIAGRSLGANPLKAFAKIYFPLSVPGIVAGVLLVFVLSLGFYVTPALIGSPQQSLIAQLLASRTRELVDFGGAGALGTVVLVIAMILLLVISRFGRGAGAVGGATAVTGGNRRSTLGWPGRVVATVVGFLLLAPTLVVIPMSFSAGNTFQFPPKEWSLRWYESFFTSQKWQYALQNSITIGLLVMLTATVLGTAAAIFIHRRRGRLASGVNSFLTLPLAVPNIVIAVAIYIVFLQWGLAGTIGGFVAAHTVLAIPFVLVAVGASLSGYDRRLGDAAASLGAPGLSTFRKVTLPLILPGVLSGAIFAFVTSFDEVVVALFLKSPRLTTLPALMYDSVTLEIDPTIGAASSLVVVATSILIIVPQLIQNHRARKRAAL